MNKILVAVDFTPADEARLALARKFAQAFKASLCLLHVADPNPDFVGYDTGPQEVRDRVARGFHREHQQLHELEARLRAAEIETSAFLIQGPTAEKIVEEAKRLSAELIILGSHGHGALRQAFSGSVCNQVLQHAPCPVLVIRDPVE